MYIGLHNNIQSSIYNTQYTVLGYPFLLFVSMIIYDIFLTNNPYFKCHILISNVMIYICR